MGKTKGVSYQFASSLEVKNDKDISPHHVLATCVRLIVFKSYCTKDNINLCLHLYGARQYSYHSLHAN
jgi:hypothetical protein